MRYLAYAQADRRERYIMEEQSSGKLLSLEQMEEDALLPDYVGAETAPSAETEALEREELRNLAEQKQILLLALLSLKDTDRELINALFFDGASTREYAQRMGVSQRAVIKRRDRILRDLKKFFENSSKNLLTKEKRCDIIIGLSTNDKFTRKRRTKPSQKIFLKNFKKPLDKSKKVWYNIQAFVARQKSKWYIEKITAQQVRIEAD